MMKIDLEKLQENRLKFLAALYEIANDHVEKNQPPGGIICVGKCESVIGERAGLTRQETDQVATEVLHFGLATAQSATSPLGPSFSLTHEGCRVAQEYLYEKTPLAKRRKNVGAIKEKSAEGAASLLKESAKWIGVYLAGLLSGTQGATVIKWVKELLGFK
jgi:hypothetical protein